MIYNFIPTILMRIISLITGFYGYSLLNFLNFIIGMIINYALAYLIVNKGLNKSSEEQNFTSDDSKSLLTVQNIIKNSFKIASNNSATILLASILWILTIWIPYLNVGTTIGMWALVVGLSKQDKTFTATSIFDSKYRQYMGEFFLLVGFMALGISVGYMFFIIPGIIITFSWGQAIYLSIDKELTPLQALKTSNNITYGEKFTIFLGYLSIFLIVGIVNIFISFLLVLTEIYVLISIFSFIVLPFLTLCLQTACSIYIYGELSKKLTD